MDEENRRRRAACSETPRSRSLALLWLRLAYGHQRHHVATVSPFFGYGWRMAIRGKGTSFAHVRTWINCPRLLFPRSSADRAFAAWIARRTPSRAARSPARARCAPESDSPNQKSTASSNRASWRERSRSLDGRLRICGSHGSLLHAHRGARGAARAHSR